MAYLFYVSAFFGVIASVGQADIWMSVEGDTVDGEFIGYDANREIIILRRSNADELLEIPEKLLTQADMRKAIGLQIKKEKTYWLDDYNRRMMRNKRKRFVLLYNNGVPVEEFDLFCHKLLLRSEMKDLFKKKRITVFVQYELPVDWGIRNTPWQHTNLRQVYRDDPALVFYANTEYTRGCENIISVGIVTLQTSEWTGPERRDRTLKFLTPHEVLLSLRMIKW